MRSFHNSLWAPLGKPHYFHTVGLEEFLKVLEAGGASVNLYRSYLAGLNLIGDGGSWLH